MRVSVVSHIEGIVRKTQRQAMFECWCFENQARNQDICTQIAPT